MRIYIPIIIIFLPLVVFASCDSSGTTVVYINGILTTYSEAQKDLASLQTEYIKKTQDYSLRFTNGYNPSHLAGLGDLTEVVSQMLGSSISDYDLKTILLQIHSQINTRKIVLVGHSQGTFYSNSVYDYLVKNGEPAESVGVYNVATPASFVAGGGKYLTSENDKVINLARDNAIKFKAKQPLPANIAIALSPKEDADQFGGHSFGEVYLSNASPRIISEIDEALKKLTASEISGATDTGCFTPPAKNISYYAQQMAFAVADPTAVGMSVVGSVAITVGQIAYNGILTTAQLAINATKNLLANISSQFGNNAVNPVNGGLAAIGTFSGSGDSGAGNSQTGNGLDQLLASGQQSPEEISEPVIPQTKNQGQGTVPEDIPIRQTVSSTEQLAINETKNSTTTPLPPAVPIGGSGVVSPPAANSSGNSSSSENQSGENLADNSSSTPSDNSSSTSSNNSQSTSTPRTLPTINSFLTAYSSSSAQFDFSWLSSADSEGATSTCKYSIYDITDAGSSDILIFQTTSTDATSSYSFSHTVTETGRDYQFKFLTEDLLGLSNTTSVTVFAESPPPPPPPPPALPSQLNKDVIISTGGGQKILFSATTTISAIAFYVSPDNGSSCCSQSYVKVFNDVNDNPGVFIASSTENTIGQHDAPNELVYNFESPLSLNAESSYWFWVWRGPVSNTNGTFIYGSKSNPYPDGHSAENQNWDAYFRLIN